MFTIQFDHSAINVIMSGLSKLPYEQSANLIHGIQSEVRRQTDQQAAAAQAAAAPIEPPASAPVTTEGTEVGPGVASGE